ncbi:MAG: glutathione synthetase [Promethearchaeota archaeon CR_4]|nr:MAG: glutathione synthetase [Candidatus Lokiarchaeota archaeon CR_4]
MKWLFVIDPLESLNLSTDSTYAIMKEAVLQGLEVYYCTIQDLFYKSRIPSGITKAFSPSDGQQNLPIINTCPLSNFDLILMRKDPPYDIGYHYATQILSFVRTRVVNSPTALRNYNEKLIILHFPHLIPETIVTSKEILILNFLAEHPKGIVLKSLDSFQGRLVRWIRDASPDSIDVIKQFTHNYTTPVMIQEYLPQVLEGDKRILVLGGKILGVISRIPKKGSFLANFGQGGTGKATHITPRDEEIIAGISKFLLDNDLHFVGIDVIGNFLTEINITCPTGIVQINTLNNIHVEERIVSYFREPKFL